MKKPLIVLLTLLLVCPLACRNRESRTGEGTETIAPAAPQPSTAANETAEALTQTVDVETGRSEAEGGALTSPNPPVRTGTEGTAPPATTTTATGTAGTTATSATTTATTTTR